MSYVYFIEALGTGRIKIGLSNDPSQRLANLQTSSPVELRLLAVVPGTSVIERELHKKFAHLRVTGEWFTGGKELRAYIEEYGQAPSLITPSPRFKQGDRPELLYCRRCRFLYTTLPSEVREHDRHCLASEQDYEETRHSLLNTPPRWFRPSHESAGTYRALLEHNRHLVGYSIRGLDEHDQIALQTGAAEPITIVDDGQTAVSQWSHHWKSPKGILYTGSLNCRYGAATFKEVKDGN